MSSISNTNTIPKWKLLGVIWRQPSKSPRKLSQSLSQDEAHNLGFFMHFIVSYLSTFLLLL